MRKQIQKIIKQSSDPKLIERAFSFARKAHSDQKRHSGKEYIVHPLAAAKTLNSLHLDPPTIAAALLHDVPDDTKITLEDIKKEFGREVAFLVEGVSKLGKLRYPKDDLDVKSPEVRQKEPIDLRAENLRKMFFAMAEDLRVVLIKLADRLHNMQTLGSLPPDKRKRIALETLEIFAPLANRLGMGEMKGQLEDLAFPYLYPKEHEWLMNNVKERLEKREKQLKKITPRLIKILKKAKIEPVDVHSRPKHYWSLYQKLIKHNMDFNKIYDLVALRVIFEDVGTCYKALGVIHSHWRPLPGRFKDYIAFPKPNGYQALHTTVFCDQGQIAEIQFKTKEMHRADEYGIAAHWAMKEGINLKYQRKKFSWVQQLKDWQGKISNTQEFLEGLKFDFFKNRIFIFTPKGDVIDLPESATPIDFAYAVHSDVGNRCAGAKVNGKMTQLSHSLKNGDIVEIIVGKKKEPSRDWLKFVKTSLARSRIKNRLKQIERPEGLRGLLEKAKTISVLPKFRKKAKHKKTKKTEMVVSLAGQTGIKMCLAKCCFPKPGDEIKGYITKDKGVSIHRTDCYNLLKIQKKWPQKIVEATWDAKNKS